MDAGDKAKLCSRIFLYLMLLLNLMVIFISTLLFQTGALEALTSNTTGSTIAPNIDISSINVDFSHIKDWRPFSYLEVSLILLTLSQTFVVGLYRHHKPNQRWQTQRSMALKMLKIIWTFRTRTGPFDERKIPRGENVDDVLETKLKEWRGGTGSGTDIVSTKPFNRLRNKVFRHNQYAVLCKRASDLKSQLIEYQLANCSLRDVPPQLHKFTSNIKFQEAASQEDYDDEVPRRCQWCCCWGDSSAEATDGDWVQMVESTQWSVYSVYNRHELMRRDCGDDDYFSPMTGRQYVNHRIIPAIRFYEGRMPKYLRQKNFFAYFIGILTMGASFCAVFDIQPSSQFWVAIVTATITCLHTFEKHYKPTNNLNRYKNTVAELKKLHAFWEGLGTLRENKAFNNSRVVESGEQIMMDVSSTLC